ncbi:MAG: hypothetical protein HDS56_05655 [Barnesiella sp.]|nr:hypothetical protein [Barnesiella sp.]MBD5343940.1 hypothetical protein [Bacteroides sp.]
MKYILYLLPVLLLFAGCSSSDGPDVKGSDGSVSLSFSMLTSGAITSSRADSEGHGETDSEYRNFEDGIDISDLGVFVFAKIAGTTGDEKLVYKLTNLLSSDDARINVVGAPGSYLVNLMIRREDLKEILGGYDISPEGDALIQFRMLLLANCSSPGTNATAKWDAITGQDFPTVIDQLSEWNYAMSYIYNENGGPDAESIYSNRKKNVPMFGTNVFTATEGDLYYSRPENRVYLGQMDLLRSLAKVRVVDNIGGKNEAGYPRITSAEFLSSQAQARQVPAGAVSYQNGQQVHTPNIFEDNDLILAATYRLGTIPDVSVMPGTNHTGDVFIGFVPEQRIGHPNNNTEEGMPVYHVTIANQKADGSMETLDYYVPMTGYNNGYSSQNFSFGENILRNHIYTLSVSDFGALLELTVDVVPYRSCVLEPFFGLERD